MIRKCLNSQVARKSWSGNSVAPERSAHGSNTPLWQIACGMTSRIETRVWRMSNEQLPVQVKNRSSLKVDSDRVIQFFPDGPVCGSQAW